MRERKRKVVLFFLFVALDQFSKIVVLDLTKNLAFVNKGVAFGITLGWPWYIFVFSLGVILFLSFFLKKSSLGIILLLAGGSSNAIDRVIHGGVVDFLFLPFLPVFNLADVAVVFGLVVFFIDLLKSRTL